jgi:hypothetical protein
MTNPHFVKQDFCYKCGIKLNSHVDFSEVTSRPECGDLSVCLSCGGVSMFNEDLTLIPFDWSVLTNEGRRDVLKQLRKTYGDIVEMQ